jgi:hypothetical protein
MIILHSSEIGRQSMIGDRLRLSLSEHMKCDRIVLRAPIRKASNPKPFDDAFERFSKQQSAPNPYRTPVAAIKAISGTVTLLVSEISMMVLPIPSA